MPNTYDVYPFPGRRMAYDDDGTLVIGLRVGESGNPTTLSSFAYDIAGDWTEFSLADKQDINDEDLGLVMAGAGAGGRGTIQWITLFPELRDIDGYFWCARWSDKRSEVIAYNTSTTNGRDGTWTNFTTMDAFEDGLNPNPEGYRTNIKTEAHNGVRAIGAQMTSGGGTGDTVSFHALHLYGEIAASETPDRLLIVGDVTGLEYTLPLDYGDVPRGSARDETFKLKNNSSSLTANTIQMTAEDLDRSSASWFTFAEGAGSFQGTLTVTSLASGATSAKITVRRDLPDTAEMWLQCARMQLSVGSWT